MIFLASSAGGTPPAADLRLYARVLAQADGPGAVARWSLTLENRGPGATLGPLTISAVPAPLAGEPRASGDGWLCAAADGAVACTRADQLTAGASHPPIVVEATVAACGVARLRATASSEQGGPDVAAVATFSTPCPSPPQLEVAISAQAAMLPLGGEGRWRVTVANRGAAPTAGAVAVTAPLAPLFERARASGQGWTCSVAEVTVTCSRADPLPPRVSFPEIEIAAVAVACGTATSRATVAGGGLVAPISAAAATDIPCPPAPQVCLPAVEDRERRVEIAPPPGRVAPSARAVADAVQESRANRHQLADALIPDAEAMRRAVLDQLRDDAGKRAFIVLAYAYAPQPQQGQVLATRANERLRGAVPEMFDAQLTVMKSFDWVWSDLTLAGRVVLEVYFRTEICGPRE